MISYKTGEREKKNDFALWPKYKKKNCIFKIYLHRQNTVDQALKSFIHCGLVTPYDNTDLGQHWLR